LKKENQWLTETIKALGKLSGQARLSDIYETVADNGNIN
jgi:hypothetical protein